MFNLNAFRRDIPLRTYWVVVAAASASVVPLWCILTYGGYVSPIFLPSPTDVWTAAVELYQSGVFIGDLGRSCERVFGGFVAAVIVSIPIGILMGNFRVLEAVIEPFLAFTRYMPVPAFIPLIILYAGIDEFSKMLVIFIGTSVQMIIMISDVAKRVSADLCKVALTLGATSTDCRQSRLARQPAGDRRRVSDQLGLGVDLSHRRRSTCRQPRARISHH